VSETPPAPDPAPGQAQPPPAPARWFVQLDLALLGASFAWFAYVDAPITDGAMRLFALAVLSALLSLLAALRSGEAATAVAGARSRRVALWLFAIATALMLTAATLTLNLRGSGDEDSDTPTRVSLPA
jgi:hypothetical protein